MYFQEQPQILFLSSYSMPISLVCKYYARYYICHMPSPHDDAMDCVNVDLCEFRKQTLMEH